MATAAEVTPYPGRTFKGATALVKNVVLYVGSLTALALGWQKYGDLAGQLASNTLLLIAAALPLVATLVCHTFPVALRLRRERRLKASVKGVPKEQGYFRLWPYGDSPADRKAFDRADKAHEQIFDWLQQTSQRVLFLTGRSGSGKTSLLHAHVLPRLREQEPPVRIIVLRGYQNPVEALTAELLEPGVIWKERPPTDPPDIETLVAKACAHLRPARLLVVFDQFEELLILHEQDAERRQAIERLSQAVEAGRLSGISLLFVLRSDYLGKVQELALPRLRQGDNWHEISPFTEHAARKFLTDSGLQPGPKLLDKAMHQARRAEETQGLIRPITVNMIGKILERITRGDDPRLPRERGGLLAGYLRRALAAPELRDHAPHLLDGMLSEAGTKRPRSVAELAAETQSPEATVRACLLLLGNQGIVRPLDDVADVWEIAHDFVARLLVGVLASWHARLWKRLRPWIAPLLLLPAFVLVLMPTRVDRHARAVTALSEARAVVFRVEDSALLTVGLSRFFQLDANTTHDYLDQLAGPLALIIEPEAAQKFVSAVSGLSRLELLGLRNCTQVSDLKPLAGLSGLRTLYLTSTQVSDLTPLAGLSGLQALDLAGTQVSDLTPLSRLSELRTLILNDTQVSDLTPLADLSGLLFLEITETKVTDVSPLEHLKNLTIKGP